MVDPSFDASLSYSNATASRILARYEHDQAMANEDVLAEMALGTGGTFFHNNNDLGEGFRKMAEVPEYLYLLGFSQRSSN